jgi:hypothetical protein
MAARVPISYYNSFWIKRTGSIIDDKGAGPGYVPVWPGIFWSPYNTGVFPINANTLATNIQGRNWFVEEARIKGGYNNTSVDFGVKAYLNEDNPVQLNRSNAIIYSGVFNSRTGFNETNVFSVGETISTSLDPSYGSIQKLYALDNDLTIFQENKVSKSLIDKDAIYSAEGGQTPVSSLTQVIGQNVPYLGNYGISKNPESFATFGFRRYFVDKYRGKVMRLSRDGLTEISQYGMEDFFRDQSELISDDFKRYNVVTTTAAGKGFTNSIVVTAANIANLEYGMTASIAGLITTAFITGLDMNTNTVTLSERVHIPSDAGGKIAVTFFKFVKDTIEGAWDVRDRQYTLSYQQAPTNIAFTEEFTFLNEPLAIKNTSTLSFDESIRGWTSYYTYRPNIIFSSKNSFYSFKEAKIWKHYEEDVINNRGVFYNVANPSSITFVVNSNPSIKKVFQTINYEGDNGFQISYFRSDFQRVDPDVPLTSPPSYTSSNEYQDTTPRVYSYDQGLYTDTITGQPKRAGFNRKENLYVANLINNSIVRPEEIIFGSDISGIKGYFATVKISTDNYTDVGGLKELWSVGTKFVQSS